MSELFARAHEFPSDPIKLAALCDREPHAFAALVGRRRNELDRGFRSLGGLIPKFATDTVLLIPLVDAVMCEAGYVWRSRPDLPWSWNDELQSGTDAVAQVARLARSGFLYGAVAVARSQLERWSLNIAYNLNAAPRQDGEGKDEWLARVWGSHPQYRGHDAAHAWNVLSELLHGRRWMAAACDTEWTWPPSHTLPTTDVMTVIVAAWKAMDIAFRVVRSGVWGVANVIELGAGAPTRLDILQIGAVEGEFEERGMFRKFLMPIDFILPFSSAADEMVDKARAYRELVSDSANGDPDLLTRTPGLAEMALVERRGRAVEIARFAFAREHHLRGTDVDDHLAGTALVFRLSAIAEAARIAAKQSRPDARDALRIAAAALDSATTLWLEDDNTCLVCVRGVIEQTARARTWRLKPGQAQRLQDAAVSPSRWLSKAGWSRLNLLLNALGEFAHRSHENRLAAARSTLQMYLPPPEDTDVSRLRGDALDAAALLFADEVSARLQELDPRLGKAFRREVTLTADADHARQVEEILRRGLLGGRQPSAPDRSYRN